MAQLKASGSKLHMEAGKVGAGKHMEAWAWSVCCDFGIPKIYMWLLKGMIVRFQKFQKCMGIAS